MFKAYSYAYVDCLFCSVVNLKFINLWNCCEQTLVPNQ